MSHTRSLRTITSSFTTAGVAIAACALLVLGPLGGVSPASAASAGTADTPVALGSAAGYSALAGPSIANTGAGTVLALDLGVSGTLAGFPPGTVTGATHIADDTVATAHTDRQAAYDAVVARTGGIAFSGDLAGRTFTPGLYSTAAAVTNSGTVTLNAGGDPNATFVFQVGAALSSAASTKVVLTNGALANNVYWQVVGAVSLGAGAQFVGTLLAAGAISFGDGASLKGRALTSSTIALSNSPITPPIDDLVAPLVAIDGGPTRSTNDTTPPISGTTDEPGTPLVTLTIGSQQLTARAAGGVWTMSANALTAGPHDMVASVTDPSQNTGTATQVLTVDTSAPTVAMTGGSRVATNDTTPTISGTTDESGTPTVTVTVDGQTLTTTAGASGAWAVDVGSLAETPYGVQASVTDAAGNTGTVAQILTVDVTVPVVTINGGSTRSTSDTSPWTYGTTAEQAGTTVHLSVGGQSLDATVQPGGTWGVSAQTLASGTYTVVATITDAAGNTGTMTQTLAVGPPPVPAVTPPGAVGTYRPDAEVRLVGHAFVGRGIYGPLTQRATSVLNGHPARTATFEIRITNRGNKADQVAIRGTARSAQFTVAYFHAGRNVTAAILNGSYRSATVQPGQSVMLTVRVTKLRYARTGSHRTFTIRTTSAHDPAEGDTVAAVVKVARG
ncbi:MAG: hypothetical protein JWQ32_1312 [Marmoricola sp.]|nr:hypothetical protein [Marmoricola sp.]